MPRSPNICRVSGKVDVLTIELQLTNQTPINFVCFVLVDRAVRADAEDSHREDVMQQKSPGDLLESECKAAGFPIIGLYVEMK